MSAAHDDAVPAGDVDPVLMDMSAPLHHLRQQLSELRRSLADRERQLAEARQGTQVSERAVATLKGVLTDMVLKGRAELRAAHEEMVRATTERVAAAQAEAELLVADATAALTTVLGRPAPAESAWPAGVAWPAHDAPDPAADPPIPPAYSPPPPPFPPPAARPPETPWPVGTVEPPDLTRPPGRPPVAAPGSDAEDTVARRSTEPSPRGAMNGSRHRPSAVQTLDPELNSRFEQLVSLPPNTEFRTPPRGTPVVTVPLVYEATSTVVASAPPADSAFDEFWPPPDATPPPLPVPPPGALALPPSGRLHFGLIDAVLPIIAVVLVVIVVLSWLG